MASSPPDSDWGILPEGWTLSDVGHGALDVVGLIPIVGEGADLANAAWHAAEGNYLEAGLSVISMVPIVGDVIGKGGKLATKGARKLAGPALDVLKRMDFTKMLAPLAKHPKIGPHVDRIVTALEKWRAKLIGEASPVPGSRMPCPEASKALGESAAMIGKTPVPLRILNKLSPAQREIFEKAIAEVEKAPIVAGRDRAVFYSGKVGDRAAWEVVEDLEKKGAVDSVNTLTDGLLNRPEIRKNLPDDAMGFIDDLASKKLAEGASGVVDFVGEVERINPNSVFRRIELPALLKNPTVSPESRAKFMNMKYFLDSKYGR